MQLPAHLTVTTRSLRRFIETAAATARIPPNRLWLAARVDASLLAHPEARVPWQTLVDVARELQRAGVDAGIGLQVGAQLHLADLGVVGYVMSSSHDVAEALARLARYSRLVGDMTAIDIAVLDGRVVLRFEPRAQLDEFVRRVLCELWMALVVVLLRQLVAGATFRPRVVRMPYPAPASIQPYVDVFGVQPQFDRAGSELELTAAELAMPIRDGDDPQLAELLVGYAEMQLRALPPLDGWGASVRAAICEELPNGTPGVDAVAARLGMSGRTLQRRLREHDLTFRGLLDDTRRALALEYIEIPGLQIKQIAFLLGYASSNAFIRAFRRWSGTTPMEFARSGVPER